MSEERAGESISPIKITIEIGELSSKQKNAVLGLIKDMGFTPDEIREVVVSLPTREEEIDSEKEL